MSDDRSADDDVREILEEVNREGALVFERLVNARLELGVLAVAAAKGELVDRPLARTEREVMRDALYFAYHMANAEHIRKAILGDKAP